MDSGTKLITPSKGGLAVVIRLFITFALSTIVYFGVPSTSVIDAIKG